MLVATQLRAGIPICGKFRGAVGHVLATKYTKREHLFWCEIGPEFGIKLLAHRYGQIVPIFLLHQVMDHNHTFHTYLIVTSISLRRIHGAENGGL